MSFPIATLVFLVLMVLKLLGVITWSWWWVTAPLWIMAVISLIVCSLVGAIALAYFKGGH